MDNSVPEPHWLATELKKAHDAVLADRGGPTDDDPPVLEDPGHDEPETEAAALPEPDPKEEPPEMRTCDVCNKHQPIDEYPPYGRGRSKTCQACLAKYATPAASAKPTAPDTPVAGGTLFDRIREAASGDPTLSQLEGLASFLRSDITDAIAICRELVDA